MSEYLNFLKAFLLDIDLNVDGGDYVRYNDDAKSPILVDGRRLVLPTEAHRRNPSDDKFIFHPLNENTVADLSPVTKELMRLGSINLNILFVTYAIAVIQLASDKGLQQNLSDKQIDLIAKLKSCKSSSEKDMATACGKILYKMALENNTGCFIQIGLTRGRVYRGEKRHRAGVVSFPFYEQLLKDDTVPRSEAKIDVTKDVRHTLIEVHEAIFPAVAEEEAYGYAEVTNKTIAPFFVTFARTYAQLANNFKVCHRKLEGLEHVGNGEDVPNLDWVMDLENDDLLRKWASSIPDQNTFKPASITDGGASYTTESRKPEPTPVQQEQPQQHVATTPAPAPTTTGSRVIDPDEFVRTYSSGTTFAATQQIKTQLKSYIDGYKAYWDDHLARYNTAPANFPHPTVVPAGQLPPQYPGAPALPMGFFPGGPSNVMSAPQIGNGMMGMPMGQPMMGGVVPVMTPNGVVMMPAQQMQQQQTIFGGGAMMTGMPMNGMVPNVYMGGAVNQAAINNNPSMHPLFSNTSAGAGSIAPGTI